MSEDHRRPFDGEIKIKFLEEEDCQYSGVPGLVSVELLQSYHAQARWVGEAQDIEGGLTEVGRAYVTLRRHWELRRQALLAKDREAAEPALMARAEPEQRDLGVETDDHKVEL